ncbi:cupin domain-containing protein [Actinoplanes sp. NPDC049596]|uniref:cupin domain-containing protein n=1 Tax=unclassified Actinoplanes TaxID=2626549 RepID=UPI0034346AE3
MAVFTTPDDQPVYRLLNSNARMLATEQQTMGELTVVESTGGRGHSTPRHRHLRATETFILLEGEMLIEVGDQRHEGAAGHVAVLPRGIPHSFAVISPSVRYLTLHTPAGFDRFVHELSEATAGNGPVDPATLAAVAARHDIEMLGPGVSLPDHL